MATTERAKFRCVVKEQPDGQPFLVFEPMGENLPTLQDKLLSIDLRKGTSLAEAREIAAALDDHMVGIAITSV